MLVKNVMAHLFGTKENMFDFNDINNERNTIGKIPDGMTDESELALISQSILNLIINAELGESSGRERFSMQVLNIACDQDGNLDDDRVVSVILSLIQHITSLLKSFKQIEDIDLNNYFEYFQKTIIDPLIADPNIPYYEED